MDTRRQGALVLLIGVVAVGSITAVRHMNANEPIAYQPYVGSFVPFTPPTPTPTLSPTPVLSVVESDDPTPQPTVARTPKPTPQPTAISRETTRLSGLATWYRWRVGEAAAGPDLRAALGAGWRGRMVTVWANGRRTQVTLTDWCACGDRPGGPTLIDLDVRSFAQLADPSRGVMEVAISW